MAKDSQLKGMDLEEFISESISSIVYGLDRADKQIKGKSVKLYSEVKNNRRHIEFDVAVSVSNMAHGSASVRGKVKVLAFFDAGADLKGILEKTNSTISRIKFGVRIDELKKKK